MATLDETINTALDLLERGGSHEAEFISEWVVDNLVHVLDEYRSGECTRCAVAGYDVLRIGEQIIVTTMEAKVMSPEQARMLASALLRAAEAGDG